MGRPKVFIASSSEGLSIAQDLLGMLATRTEQNCEPMLWTNRFELSLAFIESLEDACDEVDFAIFVLTADDVIDSRQVQRSVPRDNVLFELGLFMGRIGRSRCFIVGEGNLKLPTDLAGVNAAVLDGSHTNLPAKCSAISERIAKLGPRRKLGRDGLATQDAVRAFCERIEGVWWELHSDRRISFFRIDLDHIFSSVARSNPTAF